MSSTILKGPYLATLIHQTPLLPESVFSNPLPRFMRTRQRKIIWLLLFNLACITLLINPAVGQPGPQPTLADLQKRYQPRLDELAIQIGNEQLNAKLYVERSRIYRVFARQAGYEQKPGTTYFENALADLTTALELEPEAELYAERASLRQPLFPTDPAATPQSIVDRFLKGYDDQIADWEKAIELAKTDEQLARFYDELSRLILAHTLPLAKPPIIEELTSRKVKYAIWDDLDEGIKLSRKAYEYGKRLGSWWPDQYRSNVVNAYLGKASAAHDLDELEIELKSYSEGEEFISQAYSYICDYYSKWGDAFLRKRLFQEEVGAYTRALTWSEASAWNCRYLLSRRAAAYEAMGNTNAAIADYTAEAKKETWADVSGELYINRAKLYAKSGDAEKARDDLTEALKKYFNNQCPQIYRLRADAEYKLGDVDAADQDEERATSLTKRGVPSYCTNFGP